MTNESDWLGLMIGNSRLHWAWFRGEKLLEAIDSEHLSVCSESFPTDCENRVLKELLRTGKLPVYMASVVPEQTALWQNYPGIKEITLDLVPLEGIYSTMGIDRALALWGAGITWGFPCLVIDAGTALTLTGASSDRQIVGGAIMPGLKTQLQSLERQTAALPFVKLPQELPPLWAMETTSAIESGVIYTVLAGLNYFIRDWYRKFPESQIILTGGDAASLCDYVRVQYPDIGTRLIVESNLIFRGMADLCLTMNDVDRD